MALSQLQNVEEHHGEACAVQVDGTGTVQSVTDAPYQPLASDRASPVPRESGDGGRMRKGAARLCRGFNRLLRKNQDYICIRVPESRADPLPAEWWKTGLAFMWAGLNLFLTTVMITIVNERVPDKHVNPPLPDKFFDYVPRVDWAFNVTEVIGIVLVTIWLLQWLFLKHKSIVGRRFFFLMGVLYMYRMITMYVTTLPVPSMHMNCAPKLANNTAAKAQRVWQLISGGGLSITGSHIMCGDFLYSGHTVILTITFLFIKEYSPRSVWWYHVICWLLSVTGVIFILVAHEHYSVDVVVAYYITSRLFKWYHTMANNQCLRDSPYNYLSSVWWNFCFKFMEKNVKSVVPTIFSCPVSLPASLLKHPCKKYSKVQSAQEE